MKRKNNYLFGIIFGFLFSLFGIIPICFLLRDLKKVIWNSNTIIPIIILSIFIFYGILLSIASIIGFLKVKKYNSALETQTDRDLLFQLEDDVKKFRITEIEIMTFPIPFLLLGGCVALLINQIKKSSTSGIVIAIIACLFLAFIAFGIVFGKIGQIRKKDIKLIHANIKNIYIAPIITTNNNKVTIDEYLIELSYTENNAEKTVLISQPYSKEQIQHMQGLTYIPIIKKKNTFKIDAKLFSNIQRTYAERSIDFNNVKLYSSSHSTSSLDKPEQTEKIKKRIKTITKVGTSVNYIFYIVLPIFATVFLGIGIYTLIYFVKNDLTAFNIIISVVHILFAIFIYFCWIRILYVDKMKKDALKFGEKAFANSYELIDTSHNSGDEMRSSSQYGIRFTFTDKNGIIRKATESVLKISIFKFKEANIKKLPILVYKKVAIIDYDELTKLL